MSDEYFVFEDVDGYKRSSEYTAGGLCLIRIGCVLGSPPRYRIINKLGRGAFSTVWLARDLIESRNVALKIIQADRTSDSKEPTILQRLKAPDAEDPRVIQLLDVFAHASPNGTHQVLVMEPVHPIDFMRYSAFRPIFTREVVYQTIQGLAFIHNRGIAHGDLHPGSLGIAAPEIYQFSDVDIWSLSNHPYTLAIVHSSVDQNPDSFPPSPEFTQHPLSIRILDLGNTYIVGESSPPRCVMPITYAPPEVVFRQQALKDLHAPWDQSSDIWSLALCIHALTCSDSLFSHITSSLLHEMMHYCGEVPNTWHEFIRSNPFPRGRPEHADKLWKEREKVFALRGVEDPPGFIRLLRQMMVLDPAKHPSAAKLLCDPYFTSL
ncbi:kinase-like domain-containing protein [Mycena albidolilacea]|uniref:Kinase-like domain-containing protein n=1 Tax=Mycena albidolilacea TaxID=1033008 RepID=A0AAD7EVY7_9AGAR|nr:kinase-like domain-containing protein [Mycena albidolilacea]